MEKTALITGASSGIGRDMARYLGFLGYNLIIVARRKDRLEQLAEEIKTKVQIITLDLSQSENCYKLYNDLKQINIDILINNAGFGLIGEFTETSLEKEIEMINTNLKAVHILTKLFLQNMKKRNSGYILNVSSVAGFMPGPLMATYYSTKSYVLRLTQSIQEELNKAKSKVYVGALCPGPVKTEFNTVANVKFKSTYLSSEYVAKYAINKMLKRKKIILPGILSKAIRLFSKITPDKILAKIAIKVQTKKLMHK